MKNSRGQSGLWGQGISGDLPIVLLADRRPGKDRARPPARSGPRLLANQGLMVDLVIWNEDPSGYRQNLEDQIVGLIAAGSEAQVVDRLGGIFVRRPEQMLG